MKKIEIFNKNNFDLARLIAAMMVLITHGFELVGDLKNEPLYKLTNGNLRFSTIGLYVFFFTSGYLVSNSFFRTKRLGEFIWKRFLRIYPGLLAVVLLTTFVVGPFLTHNVLKDYFLTSATYQYLFTASGIYIRHILPGLFVGFQHFDHGVNGSLWSIGLEIKLYITLIILGLIYKKRLRNIFYFFLPAALIFAFFVEIDFTHLQNYFDALHARLFIIFLIGNISFLHYQKIRLNILLLAAIALAWVCTLLYYHPLVVLTEPLFFSYLTLYCCYTKKTIALKMDISYGIYIYAFLITQILIEIFGRISPPELIAWIFICIIPVSILSWIFIEKKALDQKKKYDHFFTNKKQTNVD